jgi:hypothetical protein
MHNIDDLDNIIVTHANKRDLGHIANDQLAHIRENFTHGHIAGKQRYFIYLIKNSRLNLGCYCCARLGLVIKTISSKLCRAKSDQLTIITTNG